MNIWKCHRGGGSEGKPAKQQGISRKRERRERERERESESESESEGEGERARARAKEGRQGGMEGGKDGRKEERRVRKTNLPDSMPAASCRLSASGMRAETRRGSPSEVTA